MALKNFNATSPGRRHLVLVNRADPVHFGARFRRTPAGNIDLAVAHLQWADGLDPQAVASLASRRTYPLNSSFKPTYNMAVNLIEQFGRDRTREILESSFAQFQADRAVVDLARKVRAVLDE